MSLKHPLIHLPRKRPTRLLRLVKLFKPTPRFTSRHIILLVLVLSTLITIFLNFDLIPLFYPSSQLSYETDPRAVQLASIAVADQLHDPTLRLPSHHFLNDSENEAQLIQKARIPPVFVSRLGPIGRKRLLRKLTLESNAILNFDSMPRVLIVDLQNGLGNRLRALGSALEFAFNTRRVLVLLWAADAHINATMSDLFDQSMLRNLIIIDQPVEWPVNPNDVHETLKAPGPTQIGNNLHLKTFSFMSKDRDFHAGDVKIREVYGMHIYIKTAYVIRTGASKLNLINAFIQALTPTPAVIKLVEDVERLCGGPSAISRMVGVHIRSRSIVQDNEAVDHECEYSIDGAAVTDKWRRMSTPKQFIPEMRRIRAKWPAVVRESYAMITTDKWTPGFDIHAADTDHPAAQVVPVDVRVSPRFYVAADSVETVQMLYKGFKKEDILYLPRDCDDRGAECILYAFADMIVLSRCGAMLASGWSSFSEAAERLRKRPLGVDPNRRDGYVIRTSGVDFGGASKWERCGEAINNGLMWLGIISRKTTLSGDSQEYRRKLCNDRKQMANKQGRVT